MIIISKYRLVEKEATGVFYEKCGGYSLPVL
jgi:hypothetical protein